MPRTVSVFKILLSLSFCPKNAQTTLSNNMDRDHYTNSIQEQECPLPPDYACSQPGPTYFDHLDCPRWSAATEPMTSVCHAQEICPSQLFGPATSDGHIINGLNTHYTKSIQELEHYTLPDGQLGSTYLDRLVCRPWSATPAPMTHAQEISPRPRRPLKHMDPFLADKPAPVLITRPLLDSLRGLSLPKAASTIGVSATAFKRACRSLGVVRWDFTRGPARRKRGSTPCAGQLGTESCSPTDSGPIPCSPGSDDPADDIMVPCGNHEGSNIAAAETENPWLADEEPEADDALVLEMLARPWPV